MNNKPDDSTKFEVIEVEGVIGNNYDIYLDENLHIELSYQSDKSDIAQLSIISDMEECTMTIFMDDKVKNFLRKAIEK